MASIFGTFLVLHGLVHLLYVGHSAGYFELKPGMTWPAGSWAFSAVCGDAGTRNLASACLILAAGGFIVGGVGAFALQGWWRTVVVGSAAVSAVVYCLLWNGRLRNLDGQGAVGLLINLAMLAVVRVVGWPPVGALGHQ